MILLIDNYDSFSYNLYQLIGGINPDIKVIRNDELTADEIMALKPSHIIVSPGPGRPCDAGVCEKVIKTAAGKIPILGVCLGDLRRRDNIRKEAHARKEVGYNAGYVQQAVPRAS